jgi:subtilisin family serine protease
MANRLFAAFIVTIIPALVSAGATEFTFGERVPRSIIVKYSNNLSSTSSRITSSIGAIRTNSVKPIKLEQIELKPYQNVSKTLETVKNMPGVEYAEPDYLVKAISIDSNSYEHPERYDSQLSWGLLMIDAPGAWQITQGNSNVVVAIIDSGVDYNHPDLKENMWVNPGEVPNDGIDNDKNGYVDDVNGWNFADNDNDPYDNIYHGTHIAGITGANGNSEVSGVSKILKIMAIKFISGDGYGRTSDAISGIMYAVRNGAKILNNSWGSYQYSQALRDAIEYSNKSNTLFVAAAGNDGVNTDTTPHYPSNYPAPNILSIGATDEYDSSASFSNYGTDSVDIMSPGTEILSTTPDGYSTYSGTSMSAPFVSGIAALLLSQYPTLSGFHLKRIIMESTEPIENLRGKALTYGRINAKNALLLADVNPNGNPVFPMTPQTGSFGPEVSNEEKNVGGCGNISHKNTPKSNDMLILILTICIPMVIITHKKYRFLQKT